MMKFILSIFLLLSINYNSIAQSYDGMCYSLQRGDNTDNVQIYNTTAVIKDNTITFGDLIFFEYDKDLDIYLGIPFGLLYEYDGRILLQKTIDLYILDGSPPILQLYTLNDNSIHFMLYLRGVDNERDFLIQTFNGKAK